MERSGRRQDIEDLCRFVEAAVPSDAISPDDIRTALYAEFDAGAAGEAPGAFLPHGASLRQQLAHAPLKRGLLEDALRMARRFGRLSVS